MISSATDLVIASALIVALAAATHRNWFLSLVVLGAVAMAALAAGSLFIDAWVGWMTDPPPVWLVEAGFVITFGLFCLFFRMGGRVGLVAVAVWLALEWTSVLTYTVPAPLSVVLASPAPLLFLCAIGMSAIRYAVRPDGQDKV